MLCFAESWLKIYSVLASEPGSPNVLLPPRVIHGAARAATPEIQTPTAVAAADLIKVL